jgi:hypothetical protein
MSDFRQKLEIYLAQSGVLPEISQLTPDASTREYFRLAYADGECRIACVYPESEFGLNQLRACEDVTKLFLAGGAGGLPVAKILSADETNGIVIHEDFGDTILRDVLLNSDTAAREILIGKAITLIARIQSLTPQAFASNSIASRLRFDEEKLLWELNFFKTHYFTSFRQDPLPAKRDAALTQEFKILSQELETRATVVCHRDFHAANLMLKHGDIKIIDHQDARLGSAAYDLVSLLLDRVTDLPAPEWLAGKRRILLTEREHLGLEALDEAAFANEFRLMTVQRCLKAIGTFANQIANRGKKNYAQYINPMFGIVLRACENLERFPVLQEILTENFYKS